MSVSTEPLAYSPADAAKLAGLSLHVTYQLIASGKLPARRFGRRLIVLRDDLATFLESLPEAEAS